MGDESLTGTVEGSTADGSLSGRLFAGTAGGALPKFAATKGSSRLGEGALCGGMHACSSFLISAVISMDALPSALWDICD